MRKKKNKNTWANRILVLIFLLGFAVLMYPTFSDYVNQFTASHAIAGYVEALNQIPQEEYDRLLGEASDYNRRLGYGKFIDGPPKDPEYQSLLNISGNGMMGFIEIRKLGVNLPIYHGTGESVLQHSIGHLEGSSLPVGGESTHSVLTGHRGLPTAKLFTDLDRMEEGDTFTLNVLNETMTYEVDQITIVKPEDVSGLAVASGNDYVTLVTCTPYAVNTHRLLVRGKRVEGPTTLRISADAIQIDPILVAPVLASPILLLMLIYLFVSTGKGAEESSGENAGEDSGGEDGSTDKRQKKKEKRIEKEKKAGKKEKKPRRGEPHR